MREGRGILARLRGGKSRLRRNYRVVAPSRGVAAAAVMFVLSAALSYVAVRALWPVLFVPRAARLETPVSIADRLHNTS